jgi:toxin secretion/phage lysis holin
LFGTAAAVKSKKLSSQSAWMAATRKLGSLGIIVLAAVIDSYVDLLGIDLVQVTTVFYIGPELVSILRNAAILEVPVPPQFTSVLRYFQDKEKDKDADKPLS